MRKSALIVLLAGLSVGAYAPAPLPKEPKDGKTNLEGTWALVSVGGMAKMLPRTASQMKAVLTKGRWVFTLSEKQTTEYEMVVDARSKPPTIDLKRPGAEVAAIRGIYRIEGDVLTVAYFPTRGKDRGRPKGFDETGTISMNLKREKR